MVVLKGLLAVLVLSDVTCTLGTSEVHVTRQQTLHHSTDLGSSTDALTHNHASNNPKNEKKDEKAEATKPMVGLCILAPIIMLTGMGLFNLLESKYPGEGQANCRKLIAAIVMLFGVWVGMIPVQAMFAAKDGTAGYPFWCLFTLIFHAMIPLMMGAVFGQDAARVLAPLLCGVLLLVLPCIMACLGLVLAKELAKKGMAVVWAMREATEEIMGSLPQKDTDHINSKEFAEKCDKAFFEADTDGDGKLSLAELKKVALFDLTAQQAERVKREHLWKQAFEECDANADEYIHPNEFVDVMKYVYAHAVEGNP